MKNWPWMIIYIDRNKFLDTGIEKVEKEYGIEIVVPVTRVLKGKHRGRNNYEDVPYLFNFGFLRVPKFRRYDIDYLVKLKREIPLLLGFLRDTTLPSQGFNFAMISSREVNRIIRDAGQSSIYSEHQEENIKIGDSIKLSGYPFEGLYGVVEKINKEKQNMVISIEISNGAPLKITVPFFNIYYTMYHYDMNSTDYLENGFEEVGERKLNKAYATISLETGDYEEK
jgi:transcription antitermination factor NusG